MLYQIHEFQKNIVSPINFVASHSLEVLDSLPIENHYTRKLGALLEVTERNTREFGKPHFNIFKTQSGTKISEKIIKSLPFCELKHFRKNSNKKENKILLVAPMSGHYATLLRGTVEALVENSDVYITDWINARDVSISKGLFNFDTYVQYVKDFIKELGEDITVIGICQPAPAVLCAVSLLEQEDFYLKRMVLMGGPINPDANPTEVTKFADTHSLDWFRSNLIHTVPFGYNGVGRLVYPGFLQLAGFISMNSDKHFMKHMEFFNHLVKGDEENSEKHREFYNEYMSVMDLTAEFYLDTIEKIFHKKLLVKNEMHIGNKYIDLTKIKKTSLLTIEGEKDDISAVGQTHFAHQLLKNIPKNKKENYIEKNVGHYGIFNGKKFEKNIVPKIMNFIDK